MRGKAAVAALRRRRHIVKATLCGVVSKSRCKEGIDNSYQLFRWYSHEKKNMEHQQ
jgi:hypothetical protein